ncbi:1166_t:CDS:2 [Acaulospora morrowiae]|uniref:1166_t:CDS:1 n=1 Tax=Acaulospora morrowiae TaxID=94023 RepID=A0A9N9EYQ8_9GLOM|nr:1166_t:CDS:2 [Acaulospora morrowiae]
MLTVLDLIILVSISRRLIWDFQKSLQTSTTTNVLDNIFVRVNNDGRHRSSFDSEVSYGFIAQLAGCSVAEVRQYFTGKRRSRNATQPLSPASTLSSPPEFTSESEFNELSKALTNKTRSTKNPKKGSRKANVRPLSAITGGGSSIGSQNDSLVKDELTYDDAEPDQQRKSKKQRTTKKTSESSDFVYTDGIEKPKNKRKELPSNGGKGQKKRFKRKRTDLPPIFLSEINGIAKQTDLCRFLNFRLFGVEDEDFVYGPSFKSIVDPDPIGDYEKVEASIDQQSYILDMIAPTYNKILKKELPHLKNAKTRKIPNLVVTQLCDSCETAIFSGYWMCCVCGREICLDCFDDWDDEKDKRVKCRCSYARTHTKEQMIPIYHYTHDEITRLIEETEKRMANRDDDGVVIEEDDYELPDPIPPLALVQPDNFTQLDLEQTTNVDGENPHLSSDKVKDELYASPSEPQTRIVNFEVEGESRKECASESKVKVESANYTSLEFLALNETSAESHGDQNGEGARNLSQKSSDHEGLEAPFPTVASDIPVPEPPPHDRPSQPHDEHQKVVWDANDLTNEIFQGFWRKGYPILIKKLKKKLSPQLWSPGYFKDMYGSVQCETVDCNTGNIRCTSVRAFFEGFQDIEKRLIVDEKYPCLKLKDWPATDDFANMFPDHFDDFMDVLPFKEYTTRSGVLNLAHRLPINMNRPDLGPKMYNAYGSDDGEHGIGTTNLHLDMTDAVNMMAYAPAVEDRLEGEKDKPAAAVWDIYHYRDLPRVRRFLRKIANERGLRIDHPIHDQCFYLNAVLRERLLKEEGVTGWRLYQNPGDLVFVPAGCAHQVCNYTSCVKVAVDFVSPEGVGRSYNISQQFRKLSRSHKRRRDILQLQSILHHSWSTARIGKKKGEKDA